MIENFEAFRYSEYDKNFEGSTAVMESILEEQGRDARTNYDCDDSNSVISHATTTLSSASRRSAPISSPSRIREVRKMTENLKIKDSMSDVGGGRSSTLIERSRSQSSSFRQKKEPTLQTQTLVNRTTVTKSQVSSSAPSSNGSGASNAGPALPLPFESTLEYGDKKDKPLLKEEHGQIMARYTRISLLLRNWNGKCYWARHKLCCLLLFDSKDDYLKWKVLFDEGEKSKAMRLVKFELDFDVRSKNSKLKKNIFKYWMGNIKPKKYSAKEDYLHQFKIEKSTQAGTNVIAAFASRKPEDLNKLRKIIKRCIKRGGVGKDKKKQRIILPKTMVASSGRVSSQNATTTPQVTKGRFITTMYDFDVDDGSSVFSDGIEAPSRVSSVRFGSPRSKSRRLTGIV